MAPRAIVAVISVATIMVGLFVLFRGLTAQPGFVTSTGAACDAGEQLQSYRLEDCGPAEPAGQTVGSVLAGLGLLGLIYARLLMSPTPAKRRRRLNPPT